MDLDKQELKKKIALNNVIQVRQLLISKKLTEAVLRFYVFTEHLYQEVKIDKTVKVRVRPESTMLI